jgi:hypothetical protein
MKRSFHTREAIGPAIALVANVFLLAVILTSFGEDLAIISDGGGWNAGLSAPIGSAFTRKPIDAYKQVLAKPVFFKSREPFVTLLPRSSVVAAAPPPPMVDPNIVLGGVLISEDTRKAYVFSRNGTGGEWIVEGGEFLGWHIGAISEGGAKLEQAGRAIDLQLYPRE